jgi:DNA-binding HxlR family transcriptional regulator
MEIFGDPWSMLIIRGMLAYGAKYYSDFLRSEERIGTSVLADRLEHLEKKGIITKRTDKTDKRKKYYTLTKKGMSILPVFYDIAVWGSQASPNPKMPQAWFSSLNYSRETVLKTWRLALESGDAFFVGPNSVVKQLKI